MAGRLSIGTRSPPQLKGTYTRDEEVQAKHLTELLDVFVEADADGAFAFTFVMPKYTHNPIRASISTWRVMGWSRVLRIEKERPIRTCHGSRNSPSARWRIITANSDPIR